MMKPWGRFFGWWAGIAGFYAASGGPCPYCGAPGCPVGAASAGVMGLLFALVLQKFRFKPPSPAPNSPDAILSDPHGRAQDHSH